MRVKTTVRPGALVRSTSTGTRCSRATCSTWWSIVETGDCAESASWVTGWSRKRLTSTSIALSSVAEKSSRWPLRGVAVEEPAYGGQEAEVGHVVGLVEHGDLDRAEVAVTLVDQVLEPARAGEDDVDAAAQALDLRVLADAAEDGRVVRPAACGERARAPASIWPTSSRVGRQDQRARAACGCGRRPDSASRATSGQQERVGLAGAGAAAAEDVAAGERVGQRGGLDGSGRGDAALREDGGEVGGDAEVGEAAGRTAEDKGDHSLMVVSHQS